MKPRYNKPAKKHKDVPKQPRTQEQLLNRVQNYIEDLRTEEEINNERQKAAGKNFNRKTIILSCDDLAKKLKCNTADLYSCLKELENKGLIDRYSYREKRYRVVYENEKTRLDEEEQLYNYTIFDKCPICEKPLEIKEERNYERCRGFAYKTLKCQNECFIQVIKPEKEQIRIFENSYELGFDFTKHHNLLMKTKIEKDIKHWTTKYRYLLKILDI